MSKESAVTMRTNRFFVLSAIAMSIAAVSCTKKGSLTSSSSSVSGGSISANKVYPTSEGENWTAIQVSSRYYIKGLDLSIKGVCSRGIASIKVGESGSSGPFYAETASCGNDGSFTWNKTYTGPLDVDKTLTLVAYGVDDLPISDATDAIDVHIDNVAPPAPTITTPVSSPYTYNGASSIFNIVGSISGDAVTMTGPGGVTVTPSGSSWNHDVTLIQGSSLDFTYYTYDRAGNQSTASTQQIQWNPDISLKVADVTPGETVTDAGTSYTLEASVEAVPGSITDGSSLFELLTGLNFQTEAARQ